MKITYSAFAILLAIGLVPQAGAYLTPGEVFDLPQDANMEANENADAELSSPALENKAAIQERIFQQGLEQNAPAGESNDLPGMENEPEPLPPPEESSASNTSFMTFAGIAAVGMLLGGGFLILRMWRKN